MSLKVVNLSYERNDQPLFAEINFSVAKGELLYIVGPNGVGKTTLLKILTGNLLPTTGEIYWQAQRIHDDATTYQQALHYIGHLSGIRGALTVAENLQLLGRLQGDFQAAQSELALQKLGLSAFSHRLAKQLSSGQRKRVALAKLLLQPQPLWILDEPFNALDQSGIELVHAMMTEQLQQGGQIILTSHMPLQLPNIAIKHLYLN